MPGVETIFQRSIAAPPHTRSGATGACDHLSAACPVKLLEPILFYDGACGLCHRAVAWTIRHDRRRSLRFAPLQGRTYASLAHAGAPRDLSTLVVLDGGILHTRSGAVLAILRRCGGAWRVVAAVLGGVPAPLRDAAYDAIARRRLAWFGAADACALPRPEEAERFLP